MEDDAGVPGEVPAGGGETPQATERLEYEPPAVRVLGTVADLTAGIVPTSTDGVLPGSVL